MTLVLDAAPTDRPAPPHGQEPRAELARADEHIVRAERRLARQRALAEELAAADGAHDVAAARQAAALVGTLRRSLDVLHHRRQLLVAALAAARGGE
jgi:hypothetical protein